MDLGFYVAVVAALVAATGCGYLLVRLGFPVPEGGSRIGCIDGLRGYLALAVMCHHFSVWTHIANGGHWSQPKSAFMQSLGSGGVALFFMTTGLLFHRYVKNGFLAPSGSKSVATAREWLKIIITRLFRIQPIIWCSVAVMVALIAVRVGSSSAHWTGNDVMQTFQWLFALQTMPIIFGYRPSGSLDAYVLWSLKYEWIFYLAILPICAIITDFKPARIPPIAQAIFLLIASLVIRRFYAYGVFQFLPLFAVGMIVDELKEMASVARPLRSIAATVLAVAALLIGMNRHVLPSTASQLALYGFFFLCVACGNSVFGLLKYRAARVLGECSYGIYIVHGTVLYAAFIFLGVQPRPAVLVLPMLAVATVIVAACCYLTIERPGNNFGKRLAQRIVHRRINARSPELEVAP